MASNTYEMVHIFTEIYHRDWQTGPISRRWMVTMMVFCLLATLVDALCIFCAYSTIDVMEKLGQTGSGIVGLRIAWAVVVVDWFIEIAVGFGTAIGRRGRMSTLAAVAITNILFSAVQYGTLPIVTYNFFLKMPGVNISTVILENPAVRCYFYLSLIQSISFCLSTYTVVIWCEHDYLRGGSLFSSVLGIPFACKVKAYKERKEIRSNWRIILVRTLVYIFVLTLQYLIVATIFEYLNPVPQLERINFYVFLGFLTLASLPLIVVHTLFCWACWCLCCCLICTQSGSSDQGTQDSTCLCLICIAGAALASVEADAA